MQTGVSHSGDPRHTSRVRVGSPRSKVRRTTQVASSHSRTPWVPTAFAALGLIFVMALVAGTGPPTSPAVLPSEQTAVGEDPTPEPTIDAEDPVDFWEGAIQFAPTSFHYDSLEALTSDSHLIVRGRIIGFTEGSTEPFDQTLDAIPAVFAIVQVEEVIFGTPASKEPGRILVARLGFAVAQDASPPPEEVVLFLKNYAQMRADFGAPPALDKDDAYLYARPNAYQAVYVNREGRLFLPRPPAYWQEDFGRFPDDMRDLPFDEVVNLIEASVVATHPG